MDESQLREVERQVAIGAEIPGRDLYALNTMTRLVAESRRMRGLLLEYGRHNEGCSAAHGDQYRCRCGWREVAKEFTDLVGSPVPE
jgi:hypothetical protein